MREIKFRAWHDISGMKQFTFSDIGGYIPGQLIFDDGDIYPFDEFEVMRYTGLKDKNGKEIYEGDIVQRKVHKGDISHTREEVYWREECAGFEFVAVEKNDDGSRESWMPNCDTVALVYEIIGNIYEHPELLSESK
jgi:uncharacterized phage protein (TIGR01671 family)